jgi:hypothetical protein
VVLVGNGGMRCGGFDHLVSFGDRIRITWAVFNLGGVNGLAYGNEEERVEFHWA